MTVFCPVCRVPLPGSHVAGCIIAWNELREEERARIAHEQVMQLGGRVLRELQEAEPDARKRDCPTCGIPAGYACRTSKGDPRAFAHEERCDALS